MCAHANSKQRAVPASEDTKTKEFSQEMIMLGVLSLASVVFAFHLRHHFDSSKTCSNSGCPGVHHEVGLTELPLNFR